MKKIRSWKINMIIVLLIIASISTGFLINQESRDFRIGKNLDIFFTLFRELNTFYVDEIDPDKVIKSGIDNMLKTLDPYTVYYPESEVEKFVGTHYPIFLPGVQDPQQNPSSTLF